MNYEIENPFQKHPDVLELAKGLAPGHFIQYVDKEGNSYQIDNTLKVTKTEKYI